MALTRITSLKNHNIMKYIILSNYKHMTRYPIYIEYIHGQASCKAMFVGITIHYYVILRRIKNASFR